MCGYPWEQKIGSVLLVDWGQVGTRSGGTRYGGKKGWQHAWGEATGIVGHLGDNVEI